MAEIFTAYITKYALTQSITVAQATQVEPAMIKLVATRYTTLFFRNDWHRTPEAAIARAEEMRVKKIASLEKQIAKLRKLKFEVPA